MDRSKQAFPNSKRKSENYMDAGGYGRTRTVTVEEGGMTLREYAAVAAMQGLLANSRLTGSYEDTSCSVVVDSDFESIQRMAVKHADALLARLEESSNGNH